MQIPGIFIRYPRAKPGARPDCWGDDGKNTGDHLAGLGVAVQEGSVSRRLGWWQFCLPGRYDSAARCTAISLPQRGWSCIHLGAFPLRQGRILVCLRSQPRQYLGVTLRLGLLLLCMELHSRAAKQHFNCGWFVPEFWRVFGCNLFSMMQLTLLCLPLRS